MHTMLVILCLVFSSLSPIFASEWSYNNTKQWGRKNRYCAGHLQSPIDLQFNISRYNRHLKTIQLEETSTREDAELINNGHTVQLSLQNSYVFKDLAPLSEDYKIEQLHFHWGHTNDNTIGSEHTHEGKAYPLEMHVVSYSSLYPTMQDAMSNIRGLAVVGAFFELVDEPNPALQPIVDALQKIRAKNQRTTLTSEAFNLQSLFNKNSFGRYYRYDGSLTTPPCFESVMWTVLIDPIPISLPQLHAFRYLHDEHAHLIQNTYRKVQKLGQRILFRSFTSKDYQEDSQQRSWNFENHGQMFLSNSKLILFLIISLFTVKF